MSTYISKINLNNFPLSPSCKFDFGKYFNVLKTVRLGNHVLYEEVTPSTQDMVSEKMEVDGLIAIASVQTAGRGRSSNQWVSPKGCAMFTLVVRVPLSSYLGQRLSFLQMLASLAIVQAVDEIIGYDLKLKLKWPNDIYYGKEAKIGGILVTSSVIGDLAKCSIGCGINLDNAYPTQCINNIIKCHPDHGDLVNPISREELIATTLNQLETMIDSIEAERSMEKVKRAYLNRWLHSDQRITTADSTEATIKGVDDGGFLQIEEVKTGCLRTAHPDGNSFDMLRNLLIQK